MANRMPGIWVYRDWDAADAERGDLRVYDRYAASTDYLRMKADQFDKFARYDGKCRRRSDLACDLFMLSWTLTPATGVRAYRELPNRKLAEDIRELKCPESLRLRGKPPLCRLRGIGEFDRRGAGHEPSVGNGRRQVGQMTTRHGRSRA